jgi:hypothetical protein
MSRVWLIPHRVQHQDIFPRRIDIPSVRTNSNLFLQLSNIGWSNASIVVRWPVMALGVGSFVVERVGGLNKVGAGRVVLINRQLVARVATVQHRPRVVVSRARDVMQRISCIQEMTNLRSSFWAARFIISSGLLNANLMPLIASAEPMFPKA